MVKNNAVKDSLNSVGKGILDTLQDSTKEEKREESKEQNINDSNMEINNSGKLDTSKITVKDKSKRVKNEKTESKEKNKRSFMLNDTAVQQLKMLNLALDDKDLGEIVIESIDLYYRKHEKKVEEVINNMFNGLKK